MNEKEINEFKKLKEELDRKFSILQEAISVLYEQNARLLGEIKRLETIKCVKPITIDEKTMERCEFLLKKSKEI